MPHQNKSEGIGQDPDNFGDWAGLFTREYLAMEALNKLNDGTQCDWPDINEFQNTEEVASKDSRRSENS